MEEKKIISAPGAPSVISPYSHAVACGRFVFASGQLGRDPATGDFPPGGIEAQTRQSLMNVQAILACEGLTMDNVVKATVFLQDMNDFAAMNSVYATFFTPGQYPARSAVQVARLPKDGRVEIEVIAVR